MTLQESSIYIGLIKLRDKLYQAKTLMTKGNRLVFADMMLMTHAQVLKYYTIAFLDQEERVKYLKKAIGLYTALRVDIDICTERNVIHYTNKENDGKTDNFERLSKNEMYRLVAQIDSDMLKWYKTLTKGKTIID